MAKASILLVEDNTFQARETKNYLENSGYEVIVAGNGKSALKAAKTQDIELILLDRNICPIWTAARFAGGSDSIRTPKSFLL